MSDDATFWEVVALARDTATTGTLGGYLLGPPTAGERATQPIRGLVPDGVAIVTRMRGRLRAGYLNEAFVSNLEALLTELRAARRSGGDDGPV